MKRTHKIVESQVLVVKTFGKLFGPFQKEGRALNDITCNYTILRSSVMCKIVVTSIRQLLECTLMYIMSFLLCHLAQHYKGWMIIDVYPNYVGVRDHLKSYR